MVSATIGIRSVYFGDKNIFQNGIYRGDNLFSGIFGHRLYLHGDVITHFQVQKTLFSELSLHEKQTAAYF